MVNLIKFDGVYFLMINTISGIYYKHFTLLFQRNCDLLVEYNG
jgi:hypothetical protein